MIVPSIAALHFIRLAEDDTVACHQAVASFKNDYYVFPKEP